MDIFKNAELVEIDGNGSIHMTNYKGFEIWKISSNYQGVFDVYDIIDSDITINSNHEYINHESGKTWHSYNCIDTLISDIDNHITNKNAQIDLFAL